MFPLVEYNPVGLHSKYKEHLPLIVFPNGRPVAQDGRIAWGALVQGVSSPGNLGNKSHLSAQFPLHPSFKAQRGDRGCWLAVHLPNHDKRQENFGTNFPPPQNRSPPTTKKRVLLWGVPYIFYLCAKKYMNLHCWVKIMGWDGIPWLKRPGEITHEVTTSALHVTLVQIWEQILRSLCCQEKNNKKPQHSSTFPWGHPECDPRLKLNSVFDLLNERKGDQCQPESFCRWATILSTRIILEISHGVRPVRVRAYRLRDPSPWYVLSMICRYLSKTHSRELFPHRSHQHTRLHPLASCPLYLKP